LGLIHGHDVTGVVVSVATAAEGAFVHLFWWRSVVIFFGIAFEKIVVFFTIFEEIVVIGRIGTGASSGVGDVQDEI
jgi:hypothetical protein